MKFCPAHFPKRTVVEYFIEPTGKKNTLTVDFVRQNGLRSYILVSSEPDSDIPSIEHSVNICWVTKILHRSTGKLDIRYYGFDEDILHKCFLPYHKNKFKFYGFNLNHIVYHYASKFFGPTEVLDNEKLCHIILKSNLLKIQKCEEYDNYYPYFVVNKHKFKSFIKRAVPHCLLNIDHLQAYYAKLDEADWKRELELELEVDE